MRIVIEDTDAVWQKVVDLICQSSTPVALTASPAEVAAPRIIESLGQNGPGSSNPDMPWDARIHASSKVKTQEGRWRYKRNVDPELVKKVEAEYAQARTAPTAAPAGEATPSVAVPPPPPPPAENTAPLPPVPTTPVEALTFPDVVRLMTAKIAEGKTDTLRVNEYLKSIGIPNLITMATRPDLFPLFRIFLEAQ